LADHPTGTYFSFQRIPHITDSYGTILQKCQVCRHDYTGRKDSASNGANHQIDNRIFDIYKRLDLVKVGKPSSAIDGDYGTETGYLADSTDTQTTWQAEFDSDNFEVHKVYVGRSAASGTALDGAIIKVSGVECATLPVFSDRISKQVTCASPVVGNKIEIVASTNVAKNFSNVTVLGR
jgi:hypothetical protein